MSAPIISLDPDPPAPRLGDYLATGGDPTEIPHCDAKMLACAWYDRARGPDHRRRAVRDCRTASSPLGERRRSWPGGWHYGLAWRRQWIADLIEDDELAAKVKPLLDERIFDPDSRPDGLAALARPERRGPRRAKLPDTPLGRLATGYIDAKRSRGRLTDRSAEVEGSRLIGLVALHGDLPVDQLDRATVFAWLDRIGGYAVSSRRSFQGAGVRFCRWLAAEGYLPKDPTVDLDRVPQPRRVPRALSHDDVVRVLAACPDTKWTAVVWLMVGCGLRCVEVARLEVADWDRDTATLSVVGKGGHERVLPVPAGVTQALGAYVDTERGPVAGGMIQPGNQAHSRTGDGHITAGCVSATVSTIMVDAGVHKDGDRRTAHSLRHTCASDVLDQCRDLRVIQQMLGHASLQATQIYLRRADLGQLRRVAMEGRSYQK